MVMPKPGKAHRGRTPRTFAFKAPGWRYALAMVLCFWFMLGFQGCSQTLGMFHHPLTSSESNAFWERKQALDLYHEAWEIVFTDFVDPEYNGQNWYYWKDRYNRYIQTKDDSYACIRTMLASLNDTYSRFLEPRKAQDQNMHIDSRLFGVGIQVAAKDNQIVVIAPLEGTPAKQAGIKPLDQIVAINGEPTANLSIDDAVDRIRGPQGTPVNLTILRGAQHLLFKLVRAEITIKTVFGAPISQDVGYIRLASFISQDTAREMKAKLDAQKGTKALILDIRGNNGGLLPNALDISQMFLKQGAEIVSIVSRDGSRKTYYAQSKPIYNNPLVVLIDEGSASASEIFSGALRDNHRAILIGEKTFGKGLVQKINYLQDGSELNLTVSKYLTPSGQDINKIGILPDIPVVFTYQDMSRNRDPQKEMALEYIKQHFLAKAS